MIPLTSGWAVMYDSMQENGDVMTSSGALSTDSVWMLSLQLSDAVLRAVRPLAGRAWLMEVVLRG